MRREGLVGYCLSANLPRLKLAMSGHRQHRLCRWNKWRWMSHQFKSTMNFQRNPSKWMPSNRKSANVKNTHSHTMSLFRMRMWIQYALQFSVVIQIHWISFFSLHFIHPSKFIVRLWLLLILTFCHFIVPIQCTINDFHIYGVTFRFRFCCAISSSFLGVKIRCVHEMKSNGIE